MAYRPPVFARAKYYDGHKAGAKDVALSFGPGEVLRIDWDDGHEIWALVDMRKQRNQANKARTLVVGTLGDPMARLIVDDRDAQDRIRERATRLTKFGMPSGLRRALLWSGGALASFVLILFVLIPALADRLAIFLPVKAERALGEAVLKQTRVVFSAAFGQNTPSDFCTKDKGRAVLDDLTERLAAGQDLPHPLKVHVLDHPMVNAFAMPGGQIVLMRGLIESSESPDEVAAVLAHEIGHVAMRDPTRLALRASASAGVLGLVVGDFTGGTIALVLSEQFINAQYSQKAEAAADDYAIARLIENKISPDGLSRFMQRLADEYEEPPAIVQHFMSHPDNAARAAKARAAVGDAPTSPALSPTHWLALREICAHTSSTPDR